MSLAKKNTLYFREAGGQNTDALLGFVKEYAEKEGIKT
jgi:hypothetical protein